MGVQNAQLKLRISELGINWAFLSDIQANTSCSSHYIFQYSDQYPDLSQDMNYGFTLTIESFPEYQSESCAGMTKSASCITFWLYL